LEFSLKEDRAMYEYLASRWALKEAMVKATGRTDLEYKGLYLKKPVPVEGLR
jgi:phosphopantetheinyl transferase (holo-ACP synthase)